VSCALSNILDDWGPETLSPDQARDLLEIAEDRYDAGSILLTSQVPIDRWHDIVGNPTLADAILDRVIHNAYRIELAGESMRKRRMLRPFSIPRLMTRSYLVGACTGRSAGFAPFKIRST
jgi:hypothetical protein